MNIRNKYIVWSVFIIVGLLLFIVGGKIDIQFWQDVVRGVAGALFISGTFSVLHSAIERKEEEAYLTRLFSISSSVKDSGLLDIMTDSKDYSFKSVLHDAVHFTAIMNDGRTWVLQHYADLKIRLNTNGSTTNFYLVDPDGPFIPALARKTNYDENRLREKIRESVANLKQLYADSEKKGTMTISYLKNYPTQSLYFADNRVIVSPYQIACGRNTVPAYVYSSESGRETIGAFLARDLRNVQAESRMIWNNGNEMRGE